MICIARMAISSFPRKSVADQNTLWNAFDDPDKMRLELLMLGDLPPAQLAERARLAETCGFDAVWISDERFYREVYAILTQVALATRRVRLGPCVTDPFSPPMPTGSDPIYRCCR
jgi:hypothetical protein